MSLQCSAKGVRRSVVTETGSVDCVDAYLTSTAALPAPSLRKLTRNSTYAIISILYAVIISATVMGDIEFAVCLSVGLSACLPVSLSIGDAPALKLLNGYDCCNSLYCNLPNCQLKRLQLIQYSLARAVDKAPKSSHITPILKSLHWLKVNERMGYKLLSLTYKVLTTSQPSYLHNLISLQPRRSTGSSSVVILSHPPTISIENHKLFI